MLEAPPTLVAHSPREGELLRKLVQHLRSFVTDGARAAEREPARRSGRRPSPRGVPDRARVHHAVTHGSLIEAEAWEAATAGADDLVQDSLAEFDEIVAEAVMEAEAAEADADAGAFGGVAEWQATRVRAREAEREGGRTMLWAKRPALSSDWMLDDGAARDL